MHKHVTLKELAVLVEEKGQSEILKLVQGCEICHARMKKAEALFLGLRKKALVESDVLYKKLISETGADQEFFAFMAQAPSAQKAEKKRSPAVLRPVAWGAALLAAACLVVALNFFYDVFLPTVSSIALSEEVTQGIAVSRSGLFFGNRSVETDKVLIGRDSLVSKADLLINTGRGMELHVKDNNRFSFGLLDGLFAADLHSGTYYIVFEKTTQGLAVDLPGNIKIKITGTEIYFDVRERDSKLFVNKGRAQLLMPDNKMMMLERGALYHIRDSSKVEKKTLSHRESGEMLSAFPTLRQETERRKIPVKKLSVITTRQGKKYIGTFKVMGKKVRIITEKGTFMIPSDEIQSLEPYRE